MKAGGKIVFGGPRRGPRLACLFALLLAAVVSPCTQALADENAKQAKDRLDWMREHQTGMWNISPREGVYLYDLVIQHRLTRGLEIGTSNGYSTIWIASGMRSTGGHVLTFEINEERAKMARENFQAAGVEPFVTIQCADALEEIPKLEGPFDFVLIDAWKGDYVRYLEMVIPLVSPGGVIVAHNVKDAAEDLQEFIQKVKTDPQLQTRFANPGPSGFSISVKRNPR